MERNKEKKYDIITNPNGRRILVLNRMLEVDKANDINDEDFDATFISVAHRAYEENRLGVRWVSPVRSRKCFLKPLYVTSSLEEEFNLYGTIVDGFCSTPLDSGFTDRIEQIYLNIERFGINRELSKVDESTAKNLTNFVKYDLSRGHLTYTNAAIRGLSKGYSADFLAWYGNEESLQIDDRVKYAKMMEELGYAERVKHIERVHTCPKCGDGHLLFIECCPKCGSSNIHQEGIIHHFRCANLSPESTYQWDGELRCPKCKKILRHIGVDYDRPANAHHCLECENTFINTTMKVFCSHCHHSCTPDELLPLDIYEYRITEKGIHAFMNDEALLEITSEDIFSGHCSYEVFTSTITTFASMPAYSDHLLLIFRYKYSGVVRDWRLMDIVRSFLSHIVTFKVTSHLGEIYTMTLLPKEDLVVEAPRLREIVNQLFEEYKERDDTFDFKFLKEYVFDRDLLKAEEFINRIGQKVETNTPIGKNDF